jgi:hypothetical protein
MRCPTCNGTGEIEARAPVSLTPLQLRIYEAVQQSKDGISGPASPTGGVIRSNPNPMK